MQRDEGLIWSFLLNWCCLFYLSDLANTIICTLCTLGILFQVWIQIQNTCSACRTRMPLCPLWHALYHLDPDSLEYLAYMWLVLACTREKYLCASPACLASQMSPRACLPVFLHPSIHPSSFVIAWHPFAKAACGLMWDMENMNANLELHPLPFRDLNSHFTSQGSVLTTGL